MEYIINKEKIKLLKYNSEIIIGAKDDYYTIKKDKDSLVISRGIFDPKKIYDVYDRSYELLKLKHGDSKMMCGEFDNKSYTYIPYKHIQYGPEECRIKEDTITYERITFKVENNCLVSLDGKVIYDFENDKTFVNYNGIREFKKGNYEVVNEQLAALKDEMLSDTSDIRKEIVETLKGKLAALNIPEDKSKRIVNSLYYSLKENLVDYEIVKEAVLRIKEGYRNLIKFVESIPEINSNINLINSLVDAAIFFQMNNMDQEEAKFYVSEDGEEKRERCNNGFANSYTFDEIKEQLEIMIPGYSNLSVASVVTHPLEKINNTRLLK